MPNPKGDQHRGLYQRLVANTDCTGTQACWTWTGRCHKGYPKVSIRIDGKHRTIKPHRAMLVLTELEGEAELFGALYDAYSASEMEAEHLCYYNPRCINPDHLEWLTREEHIQRTHSERHPDATHLVA